MPQRVAGRSNRTSPRKVEFGADPRARARAAAARRRKKKSGRQFRNLVLVIAIAFVFLFTPAQEHVNRQLEMWLGDLWKSIGPAHEYPVSTQYTLQRTVEIENWDSGERHFLYHLPIPIQRTSRGVESTTFERIGGFDQAFSLQMVTNMVVGPTTPHISVPVYDEQYVVEADAVSLGDGFTEVYWPPKGSGENTCEYVRCLIWQGDVPSNSLARLVVEYEIQSFSYTWADDGTIATSILGEANGMNIENSGDFSDLYRQGWVKSTTELIGEQHQWYDRNPSGGNRDWAIDGDHPLVTATADNILASLPSTQQDNIYAFAHAAFIHVRDNVQYGQGLAYPPRSGPTCLAQQIGDCDEQANAWMSIMRTKNIPTWYEFGALTSLGHEVWEAHAWSSILIPYKDSWCIENGIELDSCYLEGSVDVVNNKWLLHTPTAFSEFLEPASFQGEAPDEFYKVMSINAFQYGWSENWQTIDGPFHNGGTYKVPYITGE